MENVFLRLDSMFDLYNQLLLWQNYLRVRPRSAYLYVWKCLFGVNVTSRWAFKPSVLGRDPLSTDTDYCFCCLSHILFSPHLTHSSGSGTCFRPPKRRLHSCEIEQSTLEKRPPPPIPVCHNTSFSISLYVSLFYHIFRYKVLYLFVMGSNSLSEY